MSQMKSQLDIIDFALSDEKSFAVYNIKLELLYSAEHCTLLINRKENKVSFMLRRRETVERFEKPFNYWKDIAGISISVNSKGNINIRATADEVQAQGLKKAAIKKGVTGRKNQHPKIFYNASNDVNKALSLMKLSLSTNGKQTKKYEKELESKLPKSQNNILHKPLDYIVHREIVNLLVRNNLKDLSHLAYYQEDSTTFTKQLSELIYPLQSVLLCHNFSNLYCVNEILREKTLEDAMSFLVLKKEVKLEAEILTYPEKYIGKAIPFLTLTRSYLTEEQRIDILGNEKTISFWSRISEEVWKKSRKVLKGLPKNLRYSFFETPFFNAGWFKIELLENMLSAPSTNWEGDWASYIQHVRECNDSLRSANDEAQMSIESGDWLVGMKFFKTYLSSRLSIASETSTSRGISISPYDAFKALTNKNLTNKALARLRDMYLPAKKDQILYLRLTKNQWDDYLNGLKQYVKKGLKRHDVPITDENVMLSIAALVVILINPSTYPDYRGCLPRKFYEHLRCSEVTGHSLEIVLKSKVNDYETLKDWLGMPDMFLAALGLSTGS